MMLAHPTLPQCVCVVTFVIIIVNNDIISLSITKQVVMINMSKQF